MAIPADLAPVRAWDLLREREAGDILRELAQRTLLTTDECLDDQLTSVDVLAVADDGASVNVMRINSGDVPTSANLAREAEALSRVVDPRDARVVLLGAGGAARAIAIELARAGASEIRIVNRSEQRGRELATHVAAVTSARPVSFEPWETSAVRSG